MDITKSFTASLNAVWKFKFIIALSFFSIIIPLIFTLAYLHVSGFLGVILDGMHLLQRYDITETDLISHLGEGGILDRLKQLVIFKNIWLLLIFMLASTLITSYLACVSFHAIAQSSMKKSASFQVSSREGMKFIARYWLVKLLMIAIILVPMLSSLALILLVPVFGSYSTANIVLFVLLLLAWIALAGWYALWVSARTFFTQPAMFFDNETAKGSIKKSFMISKGNMKVLLILIGVMYGVGSISNSFVASPIFQSVADIILSNSALKSILLALIILVLISAQALIVSFQRIFLFYSYSDFAKFSENTKGDLNARRKK